MSVSVVAHYDTRLFERMRELECGAENGMTLDTLYRAEAELVFDHLGSLDGSSILDIGCGTGLHAFVLSDRLHHRVPIRAIDIAPALIERAQARLQARRETDVREDLEFAVAEVLEVGRSSVVPPRFLPIGAITCMGDSFGYHTNAGSHRILESFFRVLRPGGRLIIQSRARVASSGPATIGSGVGFTVERRMIDGAEREVCCDPVRGDALYEYDVDCPHPDPADPEAYVELDDAGIRIYRDRDGWDYGAFERGYVDAQGQQHRLAPIWMVRSFTAERPFNGLRRVLEALGFREILLAEGRPLGTRRNLALVATRP